MCVGGRQVLKPTSVSERKEAAFKQSPQMIPTYYISQ